MLDRVPTSQPWAVTGINVGTAIPNMNDYVKTFAQIGNTVYMGGKFLQVQHGVGGPTFTQSYLAAFDVNTGEWIPTFNPTINAPVWKIMASPDGTKLFVGGEFSSVNGVANTTGLAALNPTTGAPVPSSTWQAYVSHGTSNYDVRAMSIQGNWLYLGGDFTSITGGTGFDTAGPITLSRLARVQISNGKPDFNWLPLLDTAPMDIQANPGGDRVYMVGTMSVLNGADVEPEPPGDRQHGHRRPGDRARRTGSPPRPASPSRATRSSRSATTSTRAARSTTCTPTPRALRDRAPARRPERRRRLPGPRVQGRDPLRRRATA